MKKLLMIGGLLLTMQVYSQTCLIDGQSFTPSSLPLYSYEFPSDTTDGLITRTYISVTYDSIYYADVLSYKDECISMYLVKAGLKELKHDVGYQIDEISLNGKKGIKGYLLQVYTSINHNAFISKNGSRRFGWNVVNGNILNIICPDKAAADYLAAEIDKRVNLK